MRRRIPSCTKDRRRTGQPVNRVLSMCVWIRVAVLLLLLIANHPVESLLVGDTSIASNENKLVNQDNDDGGEPVPINPMPTTPAPSYGPNHTNTTTTAPTITPHGNTTAPSSLSPTTLAPTPTPAPTKPYHPPETLAPTASPDDHHHDDDNNDNNHQPLSFFRLLGKFVAWCMLVLLSILTLGFCMNNRYQILYYLSHGMTVVWWQCLRPCWYWLVDKVRGEGASSGMDRNYQQTGYVPAPLTDPSLGGTILFESPYDNGGGGHSLHFNENLLNGQHSPNGGGGGWME